MAAPVMLCAAFEHRKTATAPISDAVAKRFEGCFSDNKSAIPLARSPPNLSARA